MSAGKITLQVTISYEVDLEELADLNVGDILRLRTAFHPSEYIVYQGDQPKFVGESTQAGDRQGVKVIASVVELDTQDENLVDLLVEDELYARGEVVGVKERLGIRITELISS